MQQHPLDISEILAAVGSFLPLWRQLHPSRPKAWKARFEPKTLVTCLQVSKLWYKTLLPILWYGYWRSDSMGHIPVQVIRRHSHFLRALELSQCSTVVVDMELFECTNLFKLSVFVDVNETKNQQSKAEGETEAEAVVVFQGTVVTSTAGEGEAPLPHGKRLVRSNPGIKKLEWEGLEYPNDTNTGLVRPVLDVEDFVGLEGLESLLLDRWDCSEGRLEQVLRIISGSLKELKVVTNYGLQLGLPRGDDGGIGGGGLMLDRLETISWHSSESDEDYLFELVKWCPNLRKLKLQVNHDGWDFSGLTNSLQTSCPKFDALRLHATRTTRHMDTLIRNSSISGFHKLHLTFEDNTDKVIHLVLDHAATLEDLHVAPYGDSGDNNNYLRLLIECTRLRRLVYSPVGVDFAEGFFRHLGQQQWGCRGLEELKVQIGAGAFCRYGKYTEDERKEVEGMLEGMGWEEVFEVGDWEREEPIQIVGLEKVLQLLAFQGLKDVKTLWLDEFTFRKIR
ncbi:hypothetical protein BG015_007601 [Linnemannia schmuckeri]|uniref:F-box domain-containing protein n=1 Tax=Linnemannia schmuckeri TaxID=64567 RepID=A0A9P5S9K7_9FUNG|nr:hypothetical protein BG015_007601 [Linnemannia schmuckeri]